MSYFVCTECGKKEFWVDLEQETVECTSCHRKFPLKTPAKDDKSAVKENVKASGEFVINNGVLRKYTGAETRITIPEGVTEIGDDCFREKVGIEEIVLPSTLIKIGEYAFSKCKSITEIEIPDSVKVIETGAFAGCSSLKTVKMPENVDKIGNSVFFGCSSLNK